MTPKTILIVDDDIDLRDNLNDILIDEGYVPISAGQCSEALNLARERDIKAAILDLKLPDNSGTKLLADLKQINPDCVCAIMTGYADLDSAIAAMKLGAFQYLQKPVHPAELLKFLDKAFETIRLRDEKRLAEDALKEKQREMRSLLDAFQGFAFLIDKDGTMLAGNQEVAAVLGKEIDQIPGTSVKDFCANASAKKTRRMAAEIIRSGKPLRYEEQLEGKYFDTIINPVFDEQGHVKQLAVFSRDISQRKRDEEEKRKLQYQLAQSQKMEAIGTLAGGIAHDFNNILGAIMGYAEIMKQTADTTDDRFISNLDQILQAGNRAKELVKQILAFSRPYENNKIPIQITSIITEVLKFLRSSLPTTIELRHNFEQGPKVIEADPTQIHQILMNLCTNAAHAMQDKGGVLKIDITSVTLDSNTPAELPNLAPGNYIKLTVTDSGCGMKPSVLKRIFDPYFTTKETGKGTGLGLSVVHGLVKSHGGAIQVTSELEKGTTISILFPQIESDAEYDTKNFVPVLGAKEHILFVDDELDLVNLNKQLLESLNYTVTTRTSSIEALEAFQAGPNKFDLVITDMTMPNMTGDILAQKLLKIRRDIPIILCTGFSEKIQNKRVEQMGIKKLLMKPLLMRDLSEAVQQVLNR